MQRVNAKYTALNAGLLVGDWRSAASALCLALVAGCAAVFPQDEARESITACAPLVTLIDEHHARTGKYPTTLKELHIPEPVQAGIAPLKLQYKTWNDNSRFMLGFTMPRAWGDPWCGYDSNAAKWNCGRK